MHVHRGVFFIGSILVYLIIMNVCFVFQHLILRGSLIVVKNQTTKIRLTVVILKVLK